MTYFNCKTVNTEKAYGLLELQQQELGYRIDWDVFRSWPACGLDAFTKNGRFCP